MHLTAEWHHFIQCHPPVRKFHVFVGPCAVAARPVRICRYLLDYSSVHRFTIVKRLTTAAPEIFIDKTRWFWHSFFWYPRFGRSCRYLRRLRIKTKTDFALQIGLAAERHHFYGALWGSLGPPFGIPGPPWVVLGQMLLRFTWFAPSRGKYCGYLSLEMNSWMQKYVCWSRIGATSIWKHRLYCRRGL